MTLPRESRRPAGPATPSGPLPAPAPTSASRTPVTSDPISSFLSLRGGRMTGSLNLAGGAGRSQKAPATPPGCPPGTCWPLWPCWPSPRRDPRLAGRCRGSPGRLGVPGAPGSGGQRHRGPGPPDHWHRAGRWQVSQRPRVDRSRPPPPGCSGKISPSNDHLVKGRAMPPLEPIWVVFVTVVLVGCVLLAVRAFRRRRR
jgi:hypothetical protein